MGKRYRAAAWLLIAVCVFTLTGCNGSDYKKAIELMESGKYAAASELFDSLGDYEESELLRNECDYQLAKAAYDKGNYETAQELFAALGDYDDSAEQAQLAADRVLEKTILGVWTAEADITGLFEDYVLRNPDDEFLEEIYPYIELSTFMLTLRLECAGDGTFALEADEKSSLALFHQFMDCFEDGLRRYFRDQYALLAEEWGITLDELYGYYGTDSIDEMLEKDIGSPLSDFFDREAMVEEFLANTSDLSVNSGAYSAEGGRIVMVQGRNITYAEYFADTDELILTDEDISETALVFTRE